MEKQFGLILPKIETREDGAEHILGASDPIINSVGDFTQFLPPPEPQSKRGVETQSCADFGTNNALETLIKFKFGLDVNFSDRALAIAADTDPNRGTSPHKVAETIRLFFGEVNEDVLPFSDDITSVAQFFSPKPLPQNILNLGKEFLKTYSLRHRWAYNGGSPEAKNLILKNALKVGTVCVSVYAWVFDNDKKVYVKPVGATDNHWVQLIRYDGDNPVIFDSYDGFIKTLDKNYDFGIAKVYFLDLAQPSSGWWESFIVGIKNTLDKLKNLFQ